MPGELPKPFAHPDLVIIDHLSAETVLPGIRSAGLWVVLAEHCFSRQR
jgi:hypothetical protein